MLQSLYDSFIDTLTAQTDAVAGNMSDALTLPLTAAMLLYIILYGIAILRGAIQEPVLDFAVRGIKLAIIWGLVSSAGDYASWVGSTINVGSAQFINSLTGGGGTVPGDSVMVQANEFATQVEDAHNAEGWSGSITGGIISFSIMITAGLFAAITFVFALLSTFALSVMAAIGPLFICFALFDATRGWFFAWLGQLLNFMLVKVLVTVLTVVIVTLMGNIYTQASAVDAVGSYIAYLIGLLCGIIFFLLIPSIASGLSAGAQSSTGMLQRSIERNLGLPTHNSSGSSRGSASRT
ncbi:type IV secretion system protein [Roseobacter litoralis]|uniref:type IV secretion system protein n=1 Tax=Roseobacter litoralis TaxID=42443 RepID=UPI002495770E|nr:type IV secretion system protein [Roseobacter litoralis]